MSANLAEYFAANRPSPYWQGGERVLGYYNGVPFVGSIGYENMRNEQEGSMATVHLDLPIKDGDVWKTIIRMPPRSLKLRSTGQFASLANVDNQSRKPGRKSRS